MALQEVIDTEARMARPTGTECRAEALHALESAFPSPFAWHDSDRMAHALDASLDRMVRLRAEFSPQDFALFFLAELQDRPDLLPRAADLRMAGARYLLANAPRLSPDLAALLPAARATLAPLQASARPPDGARSPRIRPARREMRLRRARRRIIAGLVLGGILITVLSAGAQLLSLLA